MQFITGLDTARSLFGLAPTMVVEGREVVIPEIFEFEARKLFSGQVGIPREQVIESIAASRWARQWATGLLRLTLGPEVPIPEDRVRALSLQLAERVAPAEVVLPPEVPAPPTPPTPRRRRAA